MASYTQRYLGGDHEGVWVDLRRLGPVPDALAEDCAAVAAETMRRVSGHVARLAEQLSGLGLVPAGLPLVTPPSAADGAELEVLAREIGGLPVALDACLRQVGGVWFAGDCAALDLWYAEAERSSAGDVLPDPLVLPDVPYLRTSWNDHRAAAGEESEAGGEESEESEGFVFDFAPDELHKANISGATHDIALGGRGHPRVVADPVIDGVAGRPGITLVDYLRVSIAWGGMPGWSFRPERAPAALAALRARPDF